MFENEVLKILKSVGITITRENLENPPQEEFGDLSFPCFHLSKEQKRNPNEIANGIASKIKLPRVSVIEKVEARGAYVNFFYNYSKLATTVLKEVLAKKENYGKGKRKQKIIVEFAHPNTHKLFHIGHLRNITTGESVSRILEHNGSEVVIANYQGDVGLHIAKCLWGIKNLGMEKLSSLDKKIEFLGKAYVEGNKAYENDNTKNEIIELNRKVYEKNPKVMKLWKETRKWSLNYFDIIYKRVYTKFDRLYFESEVAEPGLKITKKALKKGILTTSEGATIFDGEKYGLDKRVFVNNLGFPTYEAKELGLAELEFSEFGKVDKCVHVVGPEQSSFFKVTFKVEELLDSKKFKDKQMHLAYGWVRLKEGKMSSRLGNVVEGEWLLNELKKNILEKYIKKQDYSEKEKLEVAEAVAIGAAKYYFLKVNVSSEISFDINEAISMEGNTGPYIQYAYTRCCSILEKAKKLGKKTSQNLMPEEKKLIKILSLFPEIVKKSGDELSPTHICNYAYELSTAFSNFYEKCRVLNAETEELKNFRLNLVKSSQIVLGNCLKLLGIEPVEKM